MAKTKKPDISVDLGKGLVLKNPVMTASGTFGYGLEFTSFMNLADLGAVIVKGLSLKPRMGNPAPRIAETPCGMLNAIGLQNIGVEVFIADKLPLLADIETNVIANIFGETIDVYAEVASRLEDCPAVKAVEINISCPNVKRGGIVFGTDPAEAAKVVRAVKKAVKRLHVMTKLSPNVTDIKVMVKAVEDAGTDSISLINTLSGMAVDVEKRRPRLATVTGGLSGPAIRPVALRMLFEAAKVAGVPLIGVGGISTANDALEFIIAGASAVQVGTASFINPATSAKVAQGIEDYLTRHELDLAALRGSLQCP